MSTFVYAMLENRKQRAAAARSEAAVAALGETGSDGLPHTKGVRLQTLEREAASGQDKVNNYVEALVALIPAEVLTLHALVLTATTTIDTATNTTSISDIGTLGAAFWGLIGMSLLLYLVPRVSGALKPPPAGTPLVGVPWHRRLTAQMTAADVLRAAIPPLAFVGWTMLQRMTAFDAAFPGVEESQRTVMGLFLAALLLALASWLAFKPAAE